MTPNEKQKSIESIEQAIDQVGGASNLAKLVGCSMRAVYQWRNGVHEITEGNALKVQAHTDLSFEDIRPDYEGL